MNRCPECQTFANSKPTGEAVNAGPVVVESRKKQTYIRRRYRCGSCLHKWTTYERPEQDWQTERPPEFYRILAEYNRRSA